MDDCSYYKDWGSKSKEDEETTILNIIPQPQQRINEFYQQYYKMLDKYRIYQRIEAVLKEVESIDKDIATRNLNNDAVIIDYLDTLNAYSVKH